MLLPVIMAGGTGSRLWPMSRELYPKQFFLYSQELVDLTFNNTFLKLRF